MENLIISTHECRNFPDNFLDLNDSVPHFCWEPNLENLYLSNKDSVYELNIANKSVSPIFLLRNVLKDLSPDSHIVGLAYLSSLESLCIAVSSGELFTVEKNYSGEYQEQLVASAVSIKLIEWSPSQDTVAVLANDDQLLVMSADFDLITEQDIQTMKASEEFMSVGWGKEETQFKGSIGKKVKNDIPAEGLKLVKVLTNESLISWRGDGQLFSVSFVKAVNGTRSISIFNRDGELLFSNDDIPGIENGLAWRPSGNVIALTQRLPNKHLVCFVEKNALKHTTFDLPFAVDEVRVKQLSWSADSKVLLVWCTPLSQEEKPGQLKNGSCESLLLFSSYNYHWYLKQRLDFGEKNRPVSATWDLISDCRLHLFSASGRYDCYEFNWAVNDSQGMTAKDGAYVALVDNGRLNMTCFRFSVIPPPMCTVAISLPSTPRHVLFSPPCSAGTSSGAALIRGPPPRGTESFGDNPNDVCAILADGSIATLTYQNVDRFDVAVHKMEWECKAERPVQDLHHWMWASTDTLFCYETEENASCQYVVKITNSEKRRFVCVSSCMIDGTVVSVAAKGDGEGLVQMKDGQLFSINGSITPLERLPDVCRLLAVWQGRVFGLSKRCRLYIDGHLAGDNVTSLAFHSSFFLLTTSRQKLLTCRFTNGPLKGMLTEGEVSGVEVTGRRIERGSRIVHAVSEDTRVVLSLPRGNVECIQPRGLTLNVLIHSLESQQFRETFDLARKQRINLNIIVDHNPPAFFENVDSFVKKINEPDWLSLFLSELRDEDVTTSMYEAHYKQPRPVVVRDKVNRVCSAVREALQKHPEKEKFVLPVISSYVQTRSQSGLENALLIVKELKDQEKVSVPPVTWKAALRHMLYLTNVDELLRTALGMYDFDLVLLVASRSDKDPKEYLAFLNELNKMDVVYQRFSIDKHLQRWKSALKHLIMTGPHNKDEFLGFVKEHNLYNESLKHIFPGDERYEGLLKTYAEYLSTKRLYDEAGMVYRQIGDHFGAFSCHSKSLAWKECIVDICSFAESEQEKRASLNSFILTLTHAKMFVEAAHIHEYYLQEPDKAVSLLICGRAWQEALRVAHITRNEALLDCIRPKVDDHASYLLSRISCLEETFVRIEERLRVVRAEKLAKWKNMPGTGDGAVREDCDLFSDTSSVSGSSFSSTGSTAGTGSTGRSHGSSKNRRKHERKILSLKEGHPLEEGALVHALHTAITSAFALRDEVQETCRALVSFRMAYTARPVQEALASFLAYIQPKLKVIWPPRQTLNLEAGPNPYDEMAALDPPFQYAPTIVVRQWELTLLKEDQVK